MTLNREYLSLTSAAALYFREQLRDARNQMLRDSEAFEPVVLVLERLGRMLCPGKDRLADFKGALVEIADASHMSRDVPTHSPNYHLPFSSLFDLVRIGRNSAVHEGALARHLASHATELALILEDALMPQDPTFGTVMVRGPVTASPWHPVSFIRQSMLANSFSYLPVRMNDETNTEWRVVSDISIARYLHEADNHAARGERLRTSLESAVEQGGLRLEMPKCVMPGRLIAELLPHLDALPLLVVSGTSRELLGIVTAFDLL